MRRLIRHWQPTLTLLILCLLTVMARAQVSVEDDAGRTVTLEQPAQRIISLAPHVTELVFSAGAADKLVGVVSYSDYPEAAKQLPQVGSYKQFDFEQIAALQPDLIVAWDSGNPRALLNQLKDLGMPLYLTEPRTPEAIATNVERIARLADTVKAAQPAIRDFRQGLNALREAHADAEPVTLFYEAWNDPLMTLNGEHLFTRVTELCGGRNVFAELPSLAPRISVEAVLEKNPQVIVASGMGAERPEWLDDWKAWPDLRAVKNEQLYFVPPDLIQRSSLRILEGAKRLCEHLSRARRHYADTPPAD